MGKVAGLRCRDETGKVILSITDRICRYLGEASTGFKDGYVINDVFLEDVNAWVLPKNISLQYDSLGNKTLEYPWFYVSGNKLVWEFQNSNSGVKEAIDFYYGVY